MKRSILTTAIIFLALFNAGETKAEHHYGSGYGYFYTSLAPHGMWIELDHGVTVWQPASIRGGWAPYMHGQWIWTTDGWYWDSYEPFGHITYHYGRWYFDDYYGWIWVPDYEWAPAWVEWRYDDNYIGWAPLPPYAVFSVNIGLHFSVDYHTPYHHWHFVKYRHFSDPYVDRYYVGPKYKHRIHSNTKYRTNYEYERGRVVNRGVDVDYVRKRTGKNINTREIERVSDLSEIRNSGGRNSSERVRTFSIPREKMMSGMEDVKIRRAEKKSSLQTSRIELSSRSIREAEGGNARETEKIRTDNSGRNSESVRSRSNESSRNNAERNAAPRVREQQPSVEKRSPEITQQPNVEQRTRREERKAEPGVERRSSENNPQANVEQRNQREERKAEPRVERSENKRGTAGRQEKVEVREEKVVPRQEKRESAAKVDRQGSNERKADSNSREKRQR